MSRLAPAIRLRRRQLDSVALALAAKQAAAFALADEAASLEGQRAAERHLASAAPLSCDAWFARGAARLRALAEAKAVAELKLADLRADVVRARARLQLLEDAAAEAARAERRKRLARADAALDDRIAAGWSRR